MNLPFVSQPGEIPNEEYHRGEAYRDYISSTSLKHYFISPKYARYCQLHPREKQTPAMLEGTIYHDKMESIVNGTSFNWVSFDEPPINQRTGKPYGSDSQVFQDALNEFMAFNPDQSIAPANVLENVNNMVNEILSGNDVVSRDILYLIKTGKAEQSHFCEYQGGLFKYRTDLKTARKIIDWKKTTLEKPKYFDKVIIEYGYHISAAMYQFFEHQITGKWKKFFWVVQENEPPYDYMIHDSSQWTWEILPGGEVLPKIGALAFIKLMEQYLICLERNDFPGYSVFIQPDWKKHRIASVDVPGWFQKQNDFQFYNYD